ncbi:MAG TPA: hypothetical protein VFH73_16555 [Polyangia bacterium]|jgi:hypothetical protein|nr:hypothetical protein [Polyangia bacterium]
MRRHASFQTVIVGIVLGIAGRANAADPTTQEVTSAPAALLALADAAVDAGKLELAKALYERLVNEHPSAPEAGEARRAIKIIAAHDRATPAVPSPPAGPYAAAAASSQDGVVMRREPYSLRTSERLRLTTWEKMDFGVTAFLYGMSVGFTYTLGQSNGSNADAAPVALGALAYTLGAVGYLNAGNPDRGDLPLVLAITSYVPTTTLLVANIAYDNPDARNTAYAVAAAGLVAAPLAVLAASKLDLDPGDTQLVRDAGFWGLVLGTTGMLGFGGETRNDFGFEQYSAPSGRRIATAGLLGLYGGLALGTIAAAKSETSLERVRVTTWGGYGGAVLGLLLTVGGGNSDRAAYRGITGGALVGLIVTFLATSGLDGIPPEDAPAPHAALRRLVPTLTSIVKSNGQSQLGLGITGALF